MKDSLQSQQSLSTEALVDNIHSICAELRAKRDSSDLSWQETKELIWWQTYLFNLMVIGHTNKEAGSTLTEDHMATRLEGIDSTRNQFYVMDDQQLIDFCLDPPKMVEFNELKAATSELANRFHDFKNGY